VILPPESLEVVNSIPGMDAHILTVAERGGLAGLIELFTEMHIEYRLPEGKNPQEG